MKRRTNLLLLAMTVAVVAAALIVLQLTAEDGAEPIPYENLRAPLRNPPRDPDRPDLWEEPVIDEPPP